MKFSSKYKTRLKLKIKYNQISNLQGIKHSIKQQGVYRSWKSWISWKNPGKTLEFKSILEFLEKPWNCVENPGKITLQSIFVDICRYFNHLGRQDL